MNRLIAILGFCLLVIFGGIYLFFVYQLINEKTHIEYGNCYDKWNNKIVNLTCEKNVFDNKLYNGNGNFELLLGISIFFCFLLSLVGIYLIYIGMISERRNKKWK